MPFNAVDAIDITTWRGDEGEPPWQRVVEAVKQKVDSSRADHARRVAHSRVAYERVDDKIYPATLALLVSRIAAISDWDARDYGEDIQAVLSWVHSMAEKEKTHLAYGYDRAERQSGGDAWQWWDSGGAAERCAQVRGLRSVLAVLDKVFAESEELLARPAP